MTVDRPKWPFQPIRNYRRNLSVQGGVEIVAAIAMDGGAGRPVFRIEPLSKECALEAPVQEVARPPDHRRPGRGQASAVPVRRSVTVECPVKLYNAGVGDKVRNQRLRKISRYFGLDPGSLLHLGHR